MKLKHALKAALPMAAGMALAAQFAHAEGLPKNLTWSAYGTTSSGYAASVAVGNALADEGYKLLVQPAKNDISRMTPLRVKKIEFSAMGIGSFQAQEGVLDFGKKPWGPQPVRLILMGWGEPNVGIAATAKEAGITSAAKLKGKRLAWVIGGPALNQNLTGWLAFGGLTWDDVTKVTVPGWKASIQGIIDGNIDAATASTNSSMLFQVDSSPRGLHFFPAPHDDKEGWARLKKVAPWFSPHIATAGVGLSKEKTLEGASYGYPILITYDWMTDQAAYEMTMLLDKTYPKYKDAHASAAGFALDQQVFDWIIPYHAGAVKFFKEKGVWNDKFEAHNNKLLERQSVLAAAWEKHKDAPYETWMAERAKALKAAGFDAIWEH
jgi:TRAP transporter TAXI family solute receptor